MRKQRKDYGLKQDDRGTWHCDFSIAGRRIQRSTYTQVRTQAEEWCAEITTRTWREIKLGEKPGITWDVAVAEWFKDKEMDGKRDLATDEDRKLVLAPFLDGHQLHEFHCTPDDMKGVNINAVLDQLQTTRELKNSSRNRYRSLIIGVLNHTRDKGYNVPLFKIIRRKETHQEQRALTKDEAPVFLGCLPLHLYRPARYSLACGARQANVTGLRWWTERYSKAGKLFPHVTEDLNYMVVPETFSKNKVMLRLPLNDDAKDTLREARACPKHGHKTFVFTYYGHPMAQPYNTAYIRAVREANVHGFTWHGLRHTWTTWHLENGTPVEVVQKLGGWKSLHVLIKHYAHLINRHVDKYASNISVPALAQLPPAERMAA